MWFNLFFFWLASSLFPFYFKLLYYKSFVGKENKGQSSFLDSCFLFLCFSCQNFSTWSSDLRSLLDTISQIFILTPDSRSKEIIFFSGDLFFCFVLSVCFFLWELQLFPQDYLDIFTQAPYGNYVSEHCQCPVECVTSSPTAKLLQLLF